MSLPIPTVTLDIEAMIADAMAAANDAPERLEFTDTEFRNGELVPLNTSRNLAELLEHGGIHAAQNAMTLQVELRGHDCTPIACSGDSVRSRLISMASVSRLPKAAVDDHLTAIAESRSFHPVQKWLEDGPAWDSVKRMDEVIACLPTKDPELTRLVMRRWLVGCVACLYERKFSNKLVPVLQGEQSYRKTAFISRLASVVDASFLEGHLLDPSSKDSVLTAIRSWICELGELERTTARESGSLKAFLTKQVDSVRPPYGRSDVHKPRQTLFIGSVNGSSFLKDETGSTRFAVLEMTAPADIESLNKLLGWRWKGGRLELVAPENLRQFWLEVVELYQSGESWFLTEAEQKKALTVNEQFADRGPIYDTICDYHLSRELTGSRWFTAAELCAWHGEKPSMGTRWGKALAKLHADGKIERQELRSRRKEYRLPVGCETSSTAAEDR